MRVEVENLLHSTEGITVPWNDGDSDEYFDLRKDASLVARIAAARLHPPLGSLLTSIHSALSIFSSVRVKVWIDAPEKTAIGGEWKFRSRCDLILHYLQLRYSREHAEEVMRKLVDLWMREPSTDSLTVRIELLPCTFAEEKREGGALRIEVSARGENSDQARMRWGLGLARVQQSLLFVSRTMRQKVGIEIE